MNVITDILRQIVRRKLWPVALVLLGALAAGPFVLAKDPEPTALASAANASKVEAVPATFVSADEPTDPAKRRRVLGSEKDPFAPAELTKAEKRKRTEAKAKAKAAESESTNSAKSSASSSSPGTASGSSGAGGTATPPVAPAPTATPAPTTTVPAFSIKVRFGPTTDETTLTAKTYERMSVLPDETNPLLVYRGVEDGGKVAIFELTGKVDAMGDGTCLPTPEDCQYLKLHAGETEFITLSDTGDAATDAQFQLDLVKIYKKKTKEKLSADDAAAATESLAKASPSSLKAKSKDYALRRRNRYVFDATSGTLHKVAEGSKTPRSSL
jgi:hypothetical protein